MEAALSLTASSSRQASPFALLTVLDDEVRNSDSRGVKMGGHNKSERCGAE